MRDITGVGGDADGGGGDEGKRGRTAFCRV